MRWVHWLRSVWAWVRAFPDPCRQVWIKGSILSTGATVCLGAGCSLVVEGDIKMRRDVDFLAIDNGLSIQSGSDV